MHLPVDADARLDPRVLTDALAAEPAAALVTALAANNEVGTRNDVPALTAAARAPGYRSTSTPSRPSARCPPGSTPPAPT